MSKKVLYIGDENTYHLFDDVARRTESEIIPFYAVTASGEEIIQKALSDNYEMVIINITELINVADNLPELIKSLQNSSKNKLVVMAEGYSPQSNFIIEAAQNGVSYFMITDNAAERNRIFVDTLAGIKNVYDIMGKDQQQHQEMIEHQKQAVRNARQKYNSISVAVAAGMNRIGCTSVAIQLIKFFSSQGKSACFLDFSETGYVEECAQYYGVDSEDFEHHRITLDAVDMYYNITAEILSYIELQNYDFMVYDMGDISGKPQKQTEFLQKKYRIIVAGEKPNELGAFRLLLENIYRTKISYLFNFVPQADRETVAQDVETADSKCYFVPLMDEVFSLVSESIPLFHDIFSEDLPPLPSPEENIPKKKGLFGKHRKKKKGGLVT